MRHLVLILALLYGAPAFAQDDASCPLPQDAFTLDLSLLWSDGEFHHDYTLNQGTTLSYTRYEQGPRGMVGEAIPSSYALLALEGAQQDELTQLPWPHARAVICTLQFDRDEARSTFHAPRAELWLGYGDEALGARFLSSDAAPEARALRALLDELLTEHQE